MPYSVVDDHSDCEGWAVVKDDDGELMGCHNSESDAQDQVQALYAQEEKDSKNQNNNKESNKENRMNLDEARSRILPPVLAEKRNTVVINEHRKFPEPIQAKLDEANAEIGFVDRAGRGLEELRFKPEFRFRDDGGVDVHGYVTVYNYAYDVAGGPPWGFRETIEHGAGERTVKERDDVRFLINHEGIALARTKSGTMTLESDDLGIYVRAEGLDFTSPLVQSIVSAIKRGDMDEMSVGMRVLDEEWNDDYTERLIKELMLFDASIVTAGANPATFMTTFNNKIEETEERDEEEEEEILEIETSGSEEASVEVEVETEIEVEVEVEEEAETEEEVEEENETEVETENVEAEVEAEEEVEEEKTEEANEEDEEESSRGMPLSVALAEAELLDV